MRRVLVLLAALAVIADAGARAGDAPRARKVKLEVTISTADGKPAEIWAAVPITVTGV